MFIADSDNSSARSETPYIARSRDWQQRAVTAMLLIEYSKSVDGTYFKNRHSVAVVSGDNSTASCEMPCT